MCLKTRLSSNRQSAYNMPAPLHTAQLPQLILRENLPPPEVVQLWDHVLSAAPESAKSVARGGSPGALAPHSLPLLRYRGWARRPGQKLRESKDQKLGAAEGCLRLKDKVQKLAMIVLRLEMWRQAKFQRRRLPELGNSAAFQQ